MMGTISTRICLNSDQTRIASTIVGASFMMEIIVWILSSPILHPKRYPMITGGIWVLGVGGCFRISG